MKKAIIVGSGAGGATVAKELQGNYDVTIIEAGKSFHPFLSNLTLLEKLRKSALFFSEKQIQLLFPAMKIRKTKDKMVLVNGIGSGGTTTISAGNALRYDNELKRLGINLNTEFEELYREIPISTEHQKRWRQITTRLFDICKAMDLQPVITPKMGDYSRCIRCGRCVLGCPQNAKWDSRQYLNIAVEKGARLITKCKVEKVLINDGKATGVQVRRGLNIKFIPSDLIILAAGGLGTPVILQNSGIRCQDKLFVDPVLCVAAEWKNCFQNKEITMPFVIQRKRFILSPYFDYLSFFFNKQWKYSANNILSLMIKLADSNIGSISNKNIDKVLTDRDTEYLKEGVNICTQILEQVGVGKDNIFLGTINAGHPGGMLPLTEKEKVSFHNPLLPDNLYVADATLFPDSLGNPPILTIIAMAKRISKLCLLKS